MSQKIFIAATSILAVLAAVTLHQSLSKKTLSVEDQAIDFAWNTWRNKHSKNYGFSLSANETYRKQIFAENYRTITAWNATPGITSTQGLNKFSDMTSAERKAMHNGFKPDMATGLKAQEPHLYDTTNLAVSVDWRGKAVTDVKDQGQCGSCWAFSTTGAMEAAYYLKNGELKSFSEQDLLDCDSGLYRFKLNMGCNGGQMSLGLDFCASTGLELESEYPYVAKQAWLCGTKSSTKKTKITGHRSVPNDTDSFKAALMVGPISIGIEADQDVFHNYTGGVITSGCGTSIDHGVLAVGYGVENGVEYVLVKNSWSTTWGDNGYVKMAFNQCGVMTQGLQAYIE